MYLLASRHEGVIYVGVTSDLKGRIHKHRTHFYPNSFSARYNVTKLVYHEWLPGIVEAIALEKQIKAGSRKKKVALIEGMNPRWEDLYDTLE